MEDNFNKHLGNKLKLRRLALGLTQTKVAKAINVTFQQIQKYEKGTNGVSSNRLMQLSQFLKVPIIYFFEDFKEFKMEEVVKQKEIKKLPDPNEEKKDEKKAAASVGEKRNLIRELDKLAKLKLTDKNKGKEQIAKSVIEEKESKAYDSVLEKFASLTVESSRVKVEVADTEFEDSRF